MAKNSYFQFKQFKIEQGQCAMKVTTDACLLGAMTEVESASNILDIGAGTGLLSLMVAQRSIATITAVELDTQTCEQAHNNFKKSPWYQRLTVINEPIQLFADQTQEQFDTIICNPPFFHNTQKAPDRRRSLARHTDSLGFDELAKAISKCIKVNGKSWVLLPANFSDLFLASAEQEGLKPIKTIKVQSTDQHKPHRHILVLGKQVIEHQIESLIIYNTHPDYSNQTRQLFTPYHLFL